MKDLIIICDDSFGMDVRMIAGQMNDYAIAHYDGARFRIKGYLCPKGTALKQNNDPLPILGTPDEWMPSENERFAMGIVDPLRKKAVVEQMKAKEAKFALLWAPWVLAPITMQFGEGSIIAAQSIKVNARIKPFVTLFHCMVANAEIGEYSSVMAFANTTNSPIGRLSYIGNNAATMLDVEIGEGSYVCDNSIVVKSVKPGTTVMGIPARRIKN